MVFLGQTPAPFGDRRLTSHLFHFGLIEWFIFGRWSASKATPLSICTIHFGNPLVGVFNIRMGLNGPAPSSIVSKKTSHWPGWKQTINHNLFARCGRSPRVSEWFNITGSKGEFDTPQNWRQIPNRMVRTRKNHGFSGSLPFKHCPNGPKWSVRGASHGQFHRSLRGDGQLWLLRKMFVSICGPFFGILQAYWCRNWTQLSKIESFASFCASCNDGALYMLIIKQY